MNIKLLNNKKLAVCCLARDCANLVKKNIKKFEKLALFFDEVQFFIVENDSTDNTLEVLHQWKKKSSHTIHLPNIYKYKESLGDMEIDFTRNPHTDQYWARYKVRVARISLARDCYLNALENSQFTPDFILMCDIDVYNFSIEGILDSLTSKKDWDVVTANGYMYNFSKNSIKSIYYDSFAVELEHNPSEPLNTKTYLQRIMTDKLSSGKWQKVVSAFGGLGIYTYDAIFKKPATKYLSSIDLDKRQFCEHISFHRELIKKGFDKIYINPNMTVCYNTKMRSIAKKFRSDTQKLLSLKPSKNKSKNT